MPTYDYKCNACNHAFELFHSMTEVKRKCPACGKNALERLIGTGGAVIFKGSGFYQTDYRSANYKKAAEADSGTKAEAKSEPKSEPRADPKPAAKAENKPVKADKQANKAG